MYSSCNPDASELISRGETAGRASPLGHFRLVFASAIAASASWGLRWWPSSRNATRATEETGPPVENGPKRIFGRGCVAYSAESLHEAQLLLDLLGEAGVEATLFNEHLLGAIGELPFSQCWPKIWLTDESNLPAARQVIACYESRKKQVSNGVRRCDGCGEESPDNFELCWSCRAPLDEV